jgi:hypothetical protein
MENMLRAKQRCVQFECHADDEDGGGERRRHGSSKSKSSSSKQHQRQHPHRYSPYGDEEQSDVKRQRQHAYAMHAQHALVQEGARAHMNDMMMSSPEYETSPEFIVQQQHERFDTRGVNMMFHPYRVRRLPPPPQMATMVDVQEMWKIQRTRLIFHLAIVYFVLVLLHNSWTNAFQEVIVSPIFGKNATAQTALLQAVVFTFIFFILAHTDTFEALLALPQYGDQSSLEVFK